MIQHELIARTRRACLADDRLDAALMYGSFAAGEGDAHSDIEFWLFFDPARHAEVDPVRWCEQVAPVNLVVRNEFGTHVAFFPGPIRGEFHFATTDDIPSVGDWPARGAAVDAMLVVDRSGRLTPVLTAVPERPPLPADPDEIEALCGRFANWLVLALHVAARGEELRAQDALSHAARHLLWLARLAEDSTVHWLTPSRAAEAELPARTAAATGVAPSAALWARSQWAEGRARWQDLLARIGRPVPAALFAEIDALVAGAGTAAEAGARTPAP
ncbi:hypothetical protein [Actinacidiphila acididurans]|uniref:Lincosamide nucleotidyltransferase-like C-terminal domain-containing protein n=1 Tax=Actinacidiphila acididurans TaxID=2784346 RepID=A0ABS2U2K0_9ACTN|nr:hypothetical protein [Actinacidiphila acididurans]MBM9509431.1 hypothetical protein [Actinacidiphila acididurans]